MSDELPRGDLTAVEARQLEVWAYGRQGADVDSELTDAAVRELARRADAARAETAAAAERAAAGVVATPAAASGLSPASEARPDPVQCETQRARRRRMLATGLAGLLVAVLGFGGLITALSVPDPDPLAVFETPETQADRDWQARLTQDYVIAITQGPRVVDVGDGIVAVVFRSAAVADGRSTEYDPYCLFTSGQSDDGTSISLGGACLLPERFATDGIVVPFRESASGAGLDAVRWGPVGAPVLESGEPYTGLGGVTSALDWMVFPSYIVSVADAVSIVDDPDRLLLGPTLIPMSTDETDAADIITSAYLLRGETDEAGPVLCAHAAVRIVGDTTSCAPLSAVRRQGLAFTVTTTDRVWVVTIGADGPGRRDIVRAAD